MTRKMPERCLAALFALAAVLTISVDSGVKSMHRGLVNALLRCDVTTARKYLRWHLTAEPEYFAVALNVAASHEDRSAVLMILSYCPKIPLDNALYMAANAESPMMVRLLLEHGADATAHDNTGNSVLAYSMEPVENQCSLPASRAASELATRRDAVISLLRQRGACFTLNESIRYGDIDALKSAFERGADANACIPTRFTPLAFAYYQLKAHKADSETVRRREVVALLKEHGSHCRYFEAALQGIATELKWHLERGADPNAQYVYGVPLACFCAAAGDTESVRILLDYGASPDSATPRGRTVLMTARATRNHKLERLLLARGADDNVKQTARLTPH